MRTRTLSAPCVVIGALLASAGAAHAGEKAPEFPPFDSVAGELEKVVSTVDGSAPLYSLYKDDKSGRLLAELPKNFESQSIMVVPTVSAGDEHAGVMGNTFYGKWKRVDKSLVFIEPNLTVRTDNGQAKSSVDNLYTGRVIVDVPIVTTGPGGGPVIDLGAMMTQRFADFFPTSPAIYGSYVPGVNPRLASLTKSKAFPENIVAEYEVPNGNGQLMRLTYDFGLLEGTPGYEPRTADNRVGYFYNWHQDYAEPTNDDVINRYITRWNIEKADPKLSTSPPKQPLVWYIEHTTPVKYRRYVRDGILSWNEAFEEIGIVGALEVYQQDASTGAHMGIDPEDARYNFFRWNTSSQGYAIGPSRTNPYTGEILDGDVVWHQGLTRAVWMMLGNFAEEVVEQTMTPETIAFFDTHPTWDPRVRLAEPARRAELLAKFETGEPLFPAPDFSAPENDTNVENHMLHACHMGSLLSMNMGLATAAFDSGLLMGTDTESPDMLDGLPEEFLGQMIRYIVAHEVGHTLGLQHNFSASTIRSLEEINTPGYEGPIMSSVMEYAAPNINTDDSLEQGDWMQVGVGPYDKWAISFGYGAADTRDEVLARATEHDHRFGSQIATFGPDPRVITWDMGAEPLDFARSRMILVNRLRENLLDDQVNDGQSWARARQRYQQILSTHTYGLIIASGYIGGTYVNPFNKGDEGAPDPIVDVPADLQREALEFLIANSFDEDAFGLTPEMLRHFGKEYWWDDAGIGTILDDPAYPVHDQIGGVQATALSLVLNPTTLRRVYDNEYRAGRDALPLAELVTTITDAIWKNAGKSPNSFQRNLQREHVERLVDIALLRDYGSASTRTITTLAAAELSRVKKMLGSMKGGDAYASAHADDLGRRIERALDAAYVVTR